MPTKDGPIYTRADIARHEEALRIAMELTHAQLMVNAKLEMRDKMTAAEASRLAGIMGIITGTLAYEITTVRAYVEDFEREEQREDEEELSTKEKNLEADMTRRDF